MPSEQEKSLQDAIDKALGAAAAATNAADVAKAQAAAAAASAAKLSGSQSQDDAERAQQALKKVPYIGAPLAFVAKHAGLSSAAVVAFFLVIAPLVYPLLFSFYISVLPEKLRGAYVNVVLDSFSVDDLIEKSVRETATRFIAENNERIDFVQQFQQSWTRNGADKSPAYRFPLSDNQEFRVTLKPTQLVPVQACQNGSPKAIAANKALNNEKLFSIRIFGKELSNSGGNTDSMGIFVADDKFWKQRGGLPANQREGVVQVVLDQSIASSAWECWTINTDLTIIVHKTLGDLVAKPAKQAASSPARP